MELPITCPTSPTTASGDPHTIIGCGKPITVATDDEGLLDCACGMFFDPLDDGWTAEQVAEHNLTFTPQAVEVRIPLQLLFSTPGLTDEQRDELVSTVQHSLDAGLISEALSTAIDHLPWTSVAVRHGTDPATSLAGYDGHSMVGFAVEYEAAVAIGEIIDEVNSDKPMAAIDCIEPLQLIAGWLGEAWVKP